VSRTILVVDDDPTVLHLCQTILKLGGYSVLAASGGADALRLVQTNSSVIDLALLDVIMPIMNGVELARRIQKDYAPIKVVLMSGYGPREIANVIGGQPYPIIWKPFKAESLLRMIENVLGNAVRAATHP
jgi:CheY-like chemotaxis protein